MTTDTETTRLSRLVALLTLLQTKRTLTATELAKRFAVSTRTIYRDVRTLEQAGVPVVTIDGKGYTLLEGYRLPPVMFTREEATALLTAEKLAAGLTDTSTAQLTGTAMDKLRAALRRTDRDHLESIAPHIQVIGLGQVGHPDYPNSYQQLVKAIEGHRVVRILYNAADSEEAVWRNIEPIGLYLSQQWHVVAYCRMRQAFRNFRLDRIRELSVTDEPFTDRPETLQQYWANEQNRDGLEKVVLRFDPTTLTAEWVQRFHDARHQYGWSHEQQLPDGRLEMTFFVGSFAYMAGWLLPYAGAVSVLEPPALQQTLYEQAKRAQTFFTEPEQGMT